jgi:predicted DNA-binding ribbon-helix-helix protein
MLDKKHSITIGRHRTSITIEPIFWDSLKNIAKENKTSLRKLIEEIDQTEPENLSSAVRIFIFNYYKGKYKF